MAKSNKKEFTLLSRKYKNTDYYLTNIENLDEEIDYIKSEQIEKTDSFAIIHMRNLNPIIDKPDKGNEMNDKMIEYLENMKRDILTHVDTSIASVRTEMQDMKNDIIDIVDTKIESTKTEIIGVVDSKIESVRTEMNEKIESVKTDLGTKITNLDTKLTKEIKEIKKEIKVLKREAEKAGWDLTPDEDDE